MLTSVVYLGGRFLNAPEYNYMDRPIYTLSSEKFIFESGTFDAEDPDSDTFTNRWYSANFVALKESNLAEYPKDEALFRLTVISSFNPSFTFRLADTDTKPTVIFKSSEGAGGYDPEGLAIERVADISPDIFQEIIIGIKELDICNAPKDTRIGFDGSQWIFEVRKDAFENSDFSESEICMLDYWTPDAGEMQDMLRQLDGVFPNLPGYVKLELGEGFEQ